MKNTVLFLENEKETLEFGKSLSALIPNDFIIYLSGELGTGKTTIVRGFLNGLGYTKAIKSPTYTLVESYEIQDKQIHHFDFYRITDTEELELIGIRDYFSKDSICFIEWPERAQGFLPKPDLFCSLQMKNSGRHVILECCSKRSETCMKLLGSQS
jgi:tRNA threonylcarbamoyladenosine biosynthesis protein TsaE